MNLLLHCQAILHQNYIQIQNQTLKQSLLCRLELAKIQLMD